MLPARSTLLEAIDALLELADHWFSIRAVLLEPLRLAHVDILVELAVEVGGLHISPGEEIGLCSSRGQKEAKSVHADRVRVGVVVIVPLDLGESLGAETSLVAVDGAVGIALDIIAPSRADRAAPTWGFGGEDEVPSPCLIMAVDFLDHGLHPLVVLGRVAGLMVALRDGTNL